MSLLIKGMEIPNIENNKSIKAEIYNLNGKLKLRIMTEGYYCSQHWIYYPIVSIAMPHGRLVDADELLKDSETIILETIDDHEEVEEMIKYAPTIIEAEE